MRAGFVGLTVAAVATASHVAGGGAHTSWLAVVPATLAVALVSAVLGGRRLRAPQLVALLVAAQVGVHALSGYLHGHAVWHESSMVAAHLVGVAVTAVLLARGEGVLWRLHAWLRPRLLGSVPATPVVAGRVPVAVVAVRPVDVLLVGSLSRRGPPVSVV